eukprot:scaffold2226_cov166-Pinguiococcus_pyrenoidosus.AAC.1
MKASAWAPLECSMAIPTCSRVFDPVGGTYQVAMVDGAALGAGPGRHTGGVLQSKLFLPESHLDRAHLRHSRSFRKRRGTHGQSKHSVGRALSHGA